MSIRFSWLAAVLVSVFSPVLRAEEKSIACELRFITVTDALLERCGVDFPGGINDGRFLDEGQVRLLLTKLQEDREQMFLQTPKATLFDGQKATMQIDNLAVTLRPSTTRDGAVSLSLAASWPENRVKLDKTLTIPPGQSVLLFAGLQVTEGRNEFGPPIISKIPYVNRLYKNVGYGRESKRILLLVTPRVCDPDQPESVAPPKPSSQKEREAAARRAKLGRLLKAYETACERGEHEKAQRLGVQALTIDSSCFSKGRTTQPWQVTLERIQGGIE